jgi:Ribonucleotide reductase, small chain/SCP-2 sterol transfer family
MLLYYLTRRSSTERGGWAGFQSQSQGVSVAQAHPGSRPDYDQLYRRWEESNWSATGIDFSLDAKHWEEELDERQRDASQWNYALFLRGVEAVGRALVAEAEGAPGVAHRTFLATQIADEARNRKLMDRFLREVAGKGHDPTSTMEALDGYITWGFRRIVEELERLADELRKRPRDQSLLAQSVTLSSVIIEGVLAVPGERFLLRYLEGRDILPGLTEGLEHVAVDEERHVTFSKGLLGELIASSNEARASVVTMLNHAVPWLVGVFVPPNMDRSYVECFGYTLEEIYAAGLESLEQTLGTLGIDPSEVRLLAWDDRTQTYDERASRLVTLVETGVLGDDTKDPVPNEDALEILFDGTTRAVDLEVAASLGGPIEWAFTDAQPWHLVVTDGHALARRGRAGRPALQLEITASDWAKIAVGRGDARWALLKRRLRVHGNWQAKAKLSRLFH